MNKVSVVLLGPGHGDVTVPRWQKIIILFTTPCTPARKGKVKAQMILLVPKSFHSKKGLGVHRRQGVGTLISGRGAGA